VQNDSRVHDVEGTTRQAVAFACRLFFGAFYDKVILNCTVSRRANVLPDWEQGRDRIKKIRGARLSVAISSAAATGCGAVVIAKGTDAPSGYMFEKRA